MRPLVSEYSANEQGLIVDRDGPAHYHFPDENVPGNEDDATSFASGTPIRHISERYRSYADRKWIYHQRQLGFE